MYPICNPNNPSQWSKDKFQTIKVKSLVLRKGNQQFLFTFSETTIPTLTEQQIKSLWKLFDFSHRDTVAIHKTHGDLEAWLNFLLIYQPVILPRVLGPLFLYMTFACHPKKPWRGRSAAKELKQCCSGSTTNTLQFLFSGLTEEFVVTQRREDMPCRESRNPKIATARIEVHTGRKQSAAREMQVAGAWLRQRALSGMVASAHAGLGYSKPPDQHHDSSYRNKSMLAQRRQGSPGSWDKVGKYSSKENHLLRLLAVSVLPHQCGW